MGLIDQLIAPLEKLINEHGSAALIRKHLCLVKAKAAEQERRNDEIETQHQELNVAPLQSKDRILELEQQLHAASSFLSSQSRTDTKPLVSSSISTARSREMRTRPLTTCEICICVIGGLSSRPNSA